MIIENVKFDLVSIGLFRKIRDENFQVGLLRLLEVSGKVPCSTPKASNPFLGPRYFLLFSAEKFPISCAALAPLRLKVCLSFTFLSLLFFETCL